MKGMVFNSLNELVEEHHGIGAWNRAIDKIDSVVDGAYVSADNYPAEEMQALVMALTEELGAPAEVLLDTFGQKLFFDLYRAYPSLVDCHTELIPFIASVGTVIHEEMKIQYADAEVPTITHEPYDSRTLVFYYDSPRKLCLLAEGLVRGAAQHFDTAIKLEHPACMHRGAARCELHLTLVD